MNGSRQFSLRWAYVLVLLPLATEWLEQGRFPVGLRDWLTEAVMGAVVFACVRVICLQGDNLALLSRTDPLTGLANRRAFDEDLDREVARARRDGQRLSLALLDVDRFKQVNDRFGHDAGDTLLRHVALILRGESRHGADRAYRLGGDEFGVLMAGVDGGAAREAAVRLREAALAGPGGLEAFGAGLSAGVVELEPGESLAAFYRRADEAMYAIKKTR